MRLERTAHWAEILGNFGVIVTLVLLLLQIQDNTQALRSQAILERASPLLTPFLSDSQVPGVLAKIKAVDDAEPIPSAYMDRYGLTYEEGAVWTRHALSIWTSLEAEYVLLGETADLVDRIQKLLPYPDQQIWLENGGPEWLNTPAFRELVERLRDAA